MKNKIIKNIGIIVGTSNLAFASGVSAKGDKIVDEKLEDKNEFKGVVEVLKNIVCENIKHEDLAKEIFSKLYKCTKTENKNLKKNILNYSLNFGIKIKDVKDFFKGKIKIDKNKKNIIVLKKKPIFVPFKSTEKDILNFYKSLLNEECIILELDSNGSVEKLYNTTVDNDKKELSKKVNGEGGKPGENNFDTKDIFSSVLNNNELKKNSFISIIKLLNEKKLGYGLYDSNDYNIELDGYIIIDVDGKGENMLSWTAEEDIEAKIKNNISLVPINGSSNKLSSEDVIIAQKQINGKKKLLIAKAEDVSKGKIGDKVIDSEFYKSKLEEFFNVNFVNSTIERESKKLDNFKKFILENKIDYGIYNIKSFDNNQQTIIKTYLTNLASKNFVWEVMKKDKNLIVYSANTGNNDKFTKNNNDLKKYSINGSNGIDKIDENCVFFVINGDNFMIANFNDIINGKVNEQTIDDSFYQPAK